MEIGYACYCGLYCGNCATKAKVEPAAQNLYTEMQKAGFVDMMPFLPDGDVFWKFLKSMAEEGTCGSCKAGDGDPSCAVRLCATEKGVELCALCDEYPCTHFDAILEGYPILRQDNSLLREKGLEAWGQMQEERREKEFSYSSTP